MRKAADVPADPIDQPRLQVAFDRRSSRRQAQLRRFVRSPLGRRDDNRYVVPSTDSLSPTAWS